MRVTTLELPVPPSTNHAYATVRGRRVLSAKGRAYKARVGLICQAQRVVMIRTPVKLTIVWRRERRSGDLDNRCKIAADSLTGHAFCDDSQVTEIHLFRVDDKLNPGITVTIEEAA